MGSTILYPDNRAPDLGVEREVVGPDVDLIDRHAARVDAIDDDVWGGCDAIVVVRLPIDGDLIPKLRRTRVVVRNGVGFDNVDLARCGASGIAVCNVPDYATTEVADTAVAMMLAFARGVGSLDAALRADLRGGWAASHNVTARRLRDRCFGVVGLGRIGTAAALRARAFGMRVAFYDPLLPGGTELAFGFSRASSLAELLAAADVVSIHAPLTAETRGMIDAAAIAAMRPGACLLNTARGPICDTTALLEGLRTGRLAAVGLDVLPSEPAAVADPLVAAWQANEPWIRGRVLLNPHSAFYSPESLLDLRRKSIATACDYLRDGHHRDCVNGQFLSRRR